MNSWQVYGHDWAVELLKKQVNTHSLRHAYLITGPVGLGRRTLAVRLAQAINCPSPLEPGVPCRTCRSCKHIENGQHPDLMIIRKPEDRKDILVEQVRELSKFLSLKPFSSTHKIVIILNFEDANVNSQNALLKTLEESPSYAVLLLTAGNAEQLLPTIASRCEVLKLRPLTIASVKQFLLQKDVEEDQANLLAHLSNGRPGYAYQLSQEPGRLKFRVDKLNDIEKIIPGKARDRILFSEKLAKDRDVLRESFLVWLSFWRDVLIKSSGAMIELTNIDRLDSIENLAGEVSFAVIRDVVGGLETALERLDKNVNARLLTEVTLMDWPVVR